MRSAISTVVIKATRILIVDCEICVESLIKISENSAEFVKISETISLHLVNT